MQYLLFTHVLIGGIVLKNIFILKDWYIITFTLKVKNV
jgi:hypothetical protein